jgi:hypothetical protein
MACDHWLLREPIVLERQTRDLYFIVNQLQDNRCLFKATAVSQGFSLGGI